MSGGASLARARGPVQPPVDVTQTQGPWPQISSGLISLKLGSSASVLKYPQIMVASREQSLREEPQLACQQLPSTEGPQPVASAAGRREGAQACAEGHVSASKGGKGGHGWARTLSGSQSELRNSIPVPGFPGRGSLTLLQPRLFLALLSLPQTSFEYCDDPAPRCRELCGAQGAQRHRPTPWPHSLLSLAWRGWFAGGPAPD